MRSQQSDNEWKQLINQQAELNKYIMEEEKTLEKSKKDLLIQQYLQHESNKQKKTQESSEKRMQEQLEMDEKISRYRGDMQDRFNQQKQLKSYLSNSYQDQLSYQKQFQEEQRRKNREEEQMNIQRAQLSLQQEKEMKLRQQQQSKLEMLDFYNAKKRAETEYKLDQIKQRDSYNQMIDQQQKQQVLKEENYRKFNDIQNNAAKDFVPFDNNKHQRIQQLIERGIQQDREKYNFSEDQRKQNAMNRREDLKTGLQQQLAYKERNVLQKKQDFYNNQEEIIQKSLEQKQYEEQLRNITTQNKLQYRDILVGQLAEQSQVRQQSRSLQIGTPINLEETKRDSINMRSSTSLVHNPLLNPLPNNIQNPYLLKQIVNSPSQYKLAAGRMNYASLAQSSIITPKNNSIY